MFDEIVAISDEATVVAKYQGDEVVLVLDAAAVSRNKLRVDARKWAASKLKPRIYGDKVSIESTISLKTLSDEQLFARMAALGLQMASIMPLQGEASDDV